MSTAELQTPGLEPFTPEFQAWPKIARLNRQMVVTEKIDGTNACVIIEQAPYGYGAGEVVGPGVVVNRDPDGWDALIVAAQSRKRVISPEADNFGFARWVREHAHELVHLGPGYHFGEWWGSGIQRGYGLTDGEKRFSLFNSLRWNEENTPGCVSVVPILYAGLFETSVINGLVESLAREGSQAAPGFMNPEGVIAYHVPGNLSFKVTIEKDEEPKGKRA